MRLANGRVADAKNLPDFAPARRVRLTLRGSLAENGLQIGRRNLG
jgi:hypothetical protein